VALNVVPHWTGSWLSLTVSLVLVLAKRRTPLVVVVLVDLSFGPYLVYSASFLEIISLEYILIYTVQTADM
jgi:hypothetical protein